MTTSAENAALPLRFDRDGLVPTIIQDAATNAVLMLGFMNAEALAATRETGRVHFWSRSRQQLWRKGATSGHEQVVVDLYVNCDLNSLLITVRQVGAVCHDGYDTCYYRRLEPDDSLTIVRERSFDPASVYGAATGASDIPGGLADVSRAHFEAFAYLRDHDLCRESRTSALLHDPAAAIQPRIADELRELAGVLDGSHRHADFRSDMMLEGTQLLYWITVAALRDQIAWDELRPDRALATATTELPPATLARMLAVEADRWACSAEERGSDAAARYHAALALVGQAIQAGGISPRTLIADDLTALLARPYMASFVADRSASRESVNSDAAN